MNFKSIVGQKQPLEILIKTALRDHLPNSFLFHGPDGIGKWGMAVALTTFLNCKNRTEEDSCGVCPACIQIANLQFLDLFIAVPTPPSKSDKEEKANYWTILKERIAEPYGLIGGEKQMSIPIATIRDMKNRLMQKASPGGKRIVIIDQMDRMLTASADALLKIVEEPPENTLIIITTARKEKLLPTIISRCREIKFGRLSETEVAGYLEKEKDLTESAAQLYAGLSQGSIGTALYLMDEGNRQDREVAKMIFKGMFLSDAAGVSTEAIDLLPMRDRYRLNRVIAIWQTLFRDLILLRNGGNCENLINRDFRPELEKLASRNISMPALFEIPAIMTKVAYDIGLNVEPKAAISSLLIRTVKLISSQV